MPAYLPCIKNRVIDWIEERTPLVVPPLYAGLVTIFLMLVGTGPIYFAVRQETIPWWIAVSGFLGILAAAVWFGFRPAVWGLLLFSSGMLAFHCAAWCFGVKSKHGFFSSGFWLHGSVVWAMAEYLIERPARTNTRTKSEEAAAFAGDQ